MRNWGCIFSGQSRRGTERLATRRCLLSSPVLNPPPGLPALPLSPRLSKPYWLPLYNGSHPGPPPWSKPCHSSWQPPPWPCPVCATAALHTTTRGSSQSRSGQAPCVSCSQPPPHTHRAPHPAGIKPVPLWTLAPPHLLSPQPRRPPSTGTEPHSSPAGQNSDTFQTRAPRLRGTRCRK